jgi:hypothetical protein
VRLLTLTLLLTGLGFADTLTLRDGRFLTGSYMGGDVRTVRFAVADRVDTFRIEDISGITFEAPAPPPPPPTAREERREERREDRREERRDAAQGIELPAGTSLVVRMIDSVDSQRDTVGKIFHASLDEPVVDRNGNTVISRGADVVVKLVDDKQSGKIEGRTVLTLDLLSIVINGRTVEIDTQSITQQSASRGERSAKVIGGTAVVGAIIGAIAGGGKGAAIGAGAGGAAGTAAEVLTKGQRVRIPSETRLTFALQQPVRL